jgi:hypothetical protein
LDILPVTIHGLGHVLPKKEMMLRKGKITLKVGERVPYEVYTQLGSYQKVSKWFRKQIVETYSQLASEIENVDYWADKVIHNYVYKGIDIEWNVRRNLRKNKNYKALIETSSNAKRIKIVNCGYGEFPLLAALTLKNTEIYAFENNEEKFSLAKNCIGVPPNLHYVEDLDGFGVECDFEIDMGEFMNGRCILNCQELNLKEFYFPCFFIAVAKIKFFCRYCRRLTIFMFFCTAIYKQWINNLYQ